MESGGSKSRRRAGGPCCSRIQDRLEFVEPAPGTGLQSLPVVECTEIVRQLGIERLSRLLHLAALMDALGNLLGAEGDQHAEYDDSDLAGKLAPAI